MAVQPISENVDVVVQSFGSGASTEIAFPSAHVYAEQREGTDLCPELKLLVIGTDKDSFQNAINEFQTGGGKPQLMVSNLSKGKIEPMGCCHRSANVLVLLGAVPEKKPVIVALGDHYVTATFSKKTNQRGESQFKTLKISPLKWQDDEA